MVTILTLPVGMTEAESAGLDFSCHLTRELGESMFGNRHRTDAHIGVGKQVHVISVDRT
jgi:hypothetical protein